MSWDFRPYPTTIKFAEQTPEQQAQTREAAEEIVCQIRAWLGEEKGRSLTAWAQAFLQDIKHRLGQTRGTYPLSVKQWEKLLEIDRQMRRPTEFYTHPDTGRKMMVFAERWVVLETVEFSEDERWELLGLFNSVLTFSSDKLTQGEMAYLVDVITRLQTQDRPALSRKQHRTALFIADRLRSRIQASLKP